MSAPFETMDFAREEVVKCMSCGNCQEVCPIYLQTHKEGTVARGKIKLVDALLKGLVDPSTPGARTQLASLPHLQSLRRNLPMAASKSTRSFSPLALSSFAKKACIH